MAEATKTKGRADLVAHQRALRALAGRYPDEFDELLDGERVKVGLPPRRQRIEVDGHLAAHLYQTMSIEDVAAQLGVSRETVRRLLHGLGVDVRRAGTRAAICA